MTRDRDDFDRERVREGIAPVLETLSYAHRVIDRMPRETPEHREARAARFFGIMHEWGAARRRWLDPGA